MPLSDTAVRNAKPRDKTYKLSDERGLYLLVTPAGAKWWRLKYRFGGKEKLLSVGVYPDVPLKKARQQRDKARELLADGVDPSQRRQADKQAKRERAHNSFRAVALEWHGKQSKTWTLRHADDVLRRLERNLFPELGNRPIAEIDAHELLAAARNVESRGAHDLAHRMLGVAGQVFRYGISTKRCSRDPAADLRGALTPHKPRNQAAVKPDELPALLRAIDGYSAIGDKQTALALRLLCLTFVRTVELIGAEWSEFRDLDGDAPTWEVPAERMKGAEQSPQRVQPGRISARAPHDHRALARDAGAGCARDDSRREGRAFRGSDRHGSDRVLHGGEGARNPDHRPARAGA